MATPVHPLTPAFHDNSISYICPADHHPATPRFLLSLLATSIYLSISSVTSQALSLILSSVGPHTIIRYLNFALGKGIGLPESADLESAVGLELLGKPTRSKPESRLSITPTIPTFNSDSLSISCKSIYLIDEPVQKVGTVDLPPDENDLSASMILDGPRRVETFPFNYGGIGDKLGETCACWLMRWSADMLALEESRMGHAPSDSLSSSLEQPKCAFPSVWSKAGLSSSWACAVIASDDFFIRGEWERYEFATRVAKLRYHQKSDFLNEEKDWTNLFTNGIRYCHLVWSSCGWMSL